jgi:hypothetical protein
MHGRTHLAKIFARSRAALPLRKAEKLASFRFLNREGPGPCLPQQKTLPQSQLIPGEFYIDKPAFTDARRLIDKI